MVSVCSDVNSFRLFLYVSAYFYLSIVEGTLTHWGYWQEMEGLKKPRTPWYICGFYSVWYKLIQCSPLINPGNQKMCNTLNTLCPRCRKQDNSHPHFIFYCKLSKVTPVYISELINLNYSLDIPFKFSLKTIILGSFWIPWWCTFKNPTKILEVILMHLFKACH